MPSLEQKSGRINELEGLRGLLALWVLTAHILCWCGLLDANIPLHFETIWSLLLSGVPPVEIFIILSGFAITFFLYHQKQTYLQFMKSRFFRIYPVYLVCLLVAIPVSGLLPSIVQTASWQNTVYFQWVQQDYQYQASNTVGHIGAHLTLLNGLIPSQFLPGSATTILPPAWSITLEWQFYLVAPLLLLMLRSGIGLLALIVVSVLANRYGTPWQNSLLAFLPSQLPLFLVGIGSYHLYSKFKTIAAEGTKAPVMAIAILLAAAVLMDSTHAVALGIWVLVFGCLFLPGYDLFHGCWPRSGLFFYIAGSNPWAKFPIRSI